MGLYWLAVSAFAISEDAPGGSIPVQ